MTDDVGDLIRLTLSDLAKETPTVYDQTTPALRRAKQRRLGTLVLSAVGLLTAVGVGTPLAMATVGDDGPLPPAPPASTVSVPPSTPPAAPDEVPPTGGAPSPGPTRVDPPVPTVAPTDRPGPAPSVVPTRPPRTVRPTPSPVLTVPATPAPTDFGGPAPTLPATTQAG